MAPLTHVVEDDGIVLLATEHSHYIRKLLQVAGEQARGLLKRESTHSVFPMQEGPSAIRTGQRRVICWNLRSQLSGSRIKKKRAEPARKRGRNRGQNEEGHRSIFRKCIRDRRGDPRKAGKGDGWVSPQVYTGFGRKRWRRRRRNRRKAAEQPP